jgi:DNA-binding transcriptional LysR family regulator
MARFMESHPDVRIICDVGPRGRALDRLWTGEIDLAVSGLRVPRRDVEYRHFADDILILIVPSTHPWAKRDYLTVDELVDHPIILRETSSGTTITLNRELAKYDMNVDMFQQNLVLANTESIIQAVIEGIGPAFVSQLSAEAIGKPGAFVEIPVQGLHLAQRLLMARHTGFHASEAQTAFWDFTFAAENDDLRPLVGEAGLAKN